MFSQIEKVERDLQECQNRLDQIDRNLRLVDNTVEERYICVFRSIQARTQDFGKEGYYMPVVPKVHGLRRKAPWPNFWGQGSEVNSGGIRDERAYRLYFILRV